ncbi:cytochrome c peroxidase [Brevundimonas sp.]|uniref:cytochrome-c peroxidase n=1 Tax=Brevundimonas sp. TaxID=1871086 RepID=UPI0025BC3C04|nr:cytochrome c peroxidase [Brevundimonas sp.]
MIRLIDIPAAALVGAVVFALGGTAVSRVQTPTSDAELRLAYAGLPATWPRPDLGEGAVFTEFGPLPPPLAPADNPTTPAKAALGERLFNDPRLSHSGQIACASCHAAELGFADGLRTSFGHDRQRGRRNSISVATSAWMTPMFWDGRSGSLEDQSLHPLVDPVEMAGSLDAVVQRIAVDPAYAPAFAAAFGDDRINIDRIARALAAFQRTLKPRRSPWSRFIAGERNALDAQELRGLHLFRTRGGCANCHNGPALSDGRFHNLGLTYYGRKYEDLGRYEVTGEAADVGRFRTPSLLGVGRTGPYMHNGLFPHLDGVVNFYNAGGAHPRRRPDQADDPLFPSTDPLLEPRQLTREERQAIVAFLGTL